MRESRSWFEFGALAATVSVGLLAIAGGYPFVVRLVLWVLFVVGCVLAAMSHFGWWPFSEGRQQKLVRREAVPVLRQLHGEGKTLISEDPALKDAGKFSRVVENWEAQVLTTLDRWDLHRAAERFGPAERPHGDSHAAGHELRRRLEILEDIIEGMAG